MNRHILPALLTAVALAAPAAAEAPPADDIKKQLDDMRTFISETIRKEVGTLKVDQQVALEALRARVKALEDELQAMRTQVRAMENRTTTRQSAGDPAGAAALAPAAPAAPALARLQFRNEYLTDMTVQVNGASYVVRSGQVADVQAPAGAAVYQVIGADPAPLVRTLAANEVLTVRIFPRLQ